MIARSLFVWLTFGLALFAVTVFTQEAEFDPTSFSLALLFASPIFLSVQLGGLGREANDRFRYPSVSFLVLSAWVLGVAPSLIVDAPESHVWFRFTDSSIPIARVFFVSWCTLFVLAAGRPAPDHIKLIAGRTHLITISSMSFLMILYLVRGGLFSAYRSTESAETLLPGSQAATVQILGGVLFSLLPALFLLIATQPRPGNPRTLAWIAFAVSWLALFLMASRTAVAVGVATCLLLGRKLNLRLNVTTLTTVGIGLPLVFVLMTTYREALRASEGSTNIGQYISVASDVTSSLNVQERRANALEGFETNTRMRFWYGQQFCVVVDEWLDHGAALHGSLFSGVVRTIPTLIYPEKNQIANSMEFELALMALGKFPPIDLAPTPWMQWLFEFGLLGMLAGPIFYGLLARLIDKRLSHTGSLYEASFWLQLFALMFSPEHTTDMLALGARSMLIVITMFIAIDFAVDKLTAGSALRETATRGTQPS